MKTKKTTKSKAKPKAKAKTKAKTKAKPKTKTYRINYSVTLRGSREIEADSLEDAKINYEMDPGYDAAIDELVDWEVTDVFLQQ